MLAATVKAPPDREVLTACIHADSAGDLLCLIADQPAQAAMIR